MGCTRCGRDIAGPRHWFLLFLGVSLVAFIGLFYRGSITAYLSYNGIGLPVWAFVVGVILFVPISWIFAAVLLVTVRA